MSYEEKSERSYNKKQNVTKKEQRSSSCTGRGHLDVWVENWVNFYSDL